MSASPFQRLLFPGLTDSIYFIFLMPSVRTHSIPFGCNGVGFCWSLAFGAIVACQPRGWSPLPQSVIDDQVLTSNCQVTLYAFCLATPLLRFFHWLIKAKYCKKSIHIRNKQNPL